MGRLRSAIAAVLVAAATGAWATPAASADDVVLLVAVSGAGASAAMERAGVDVVDSVGTLGLRRVTVPAPNARAAAISLGASRGIAFAERETTVRAERVPTDEFFAAYQWGAQKVNAPAAWDLTVGSRDIVIAVLDTGVQANREMSGKLLPGRDFVNGDNDPSDDEGHGTASAAVAAATADNGGTAGLCWECSVLPVKVLDATGAGGTFDVASGITYAADSGADVINLSLGGPSRSLSMENAITYARSKGAVVVAAAGNDSTSALTYPAASPGVLSVGATLEDDTKSDYSNFGPWVKVAAPGCNPAPELDGRYTFFCGTSSATPLVSGVVGLALARGVAPTAVESALMTTAVPVGGFVASGRIDAAAMLGATATPPAPVPPPVGPTLPPPEDPPTDPVTTPVPVNRISGGDRIGTSISLANKAFPSGTDTVVLARADDYADALAAAPLAASLEAPVLLTSGATLASSVQSAVGALGATRAVIVGGTRAMPEAIVDGLAAAGVGDVRRIAGSSRFDTAALIAAELLSAGATGVYLAEGANPEPGRGWPDAVAVSALAAIEGRPILLVTRDALPAETLALLTRFGVGEATVVGGTAAVAEAVVSVVRGVVPSVERISGATRYATSRAIADRTLVAGASASGPMIATGRSFPDALAAGPAAAALGVPLLLVDGTDLARSPESQAWLLDNVGAIESVTLVGGMASVSSLVESQVASLSR